MLRRKEFSALKDRQKKNRLAYTSKNRVKKDNDNFNYLNNSSSINSCNIELESSSNIFPICTINQLEENINVRTANSSQNESDEQIKEFFFNDSVNIKNDHVDPLVDLASWKCKHNISGDAINDLLKRFKEWPENCLEQFPLDVRSLMKTPVSTEIISLGDGHYTHYGLEKALISQMNYLNLESGKIYINIHIDGLPLWKSRNHQFIPILGLIVHNTVKDPFFIGAYYGDKKPPNVHLYLKHFLTEYIKLNSEGFYHNSNHYTVEIKGVIADTVARNWLMCYPTHNAYYGCAKCIQKGVWKAGRMLFLDSHAPLRTDNTFRQNLPDRYQNISPLETIGIGMVTQVPLDPMHLLYMGVIKRLLETWSTEFGNGVGAQEFNDIFSKNYCSLAKCVPVEFVRKPRSLDELNHWKATEFRLFALYLGPVAIRNYLYPERVIHFNALHLALRILSDPKQYKAHNNYADQLLHYFVQQISVLYSEGFLIFNIHNLCHLALDSFRFGPLESFSAFPFENFLQVIKNLIHNPVSPLVQLCRRIEEKSKVDDPKIKLKDNQYSLIGQTPSVTEIKYFTGIQFSNFKILTKQWNNCCYLDSGIVVLIEKISSEKKHNNIVGRKFINTSSVQDFPCDSQIFGIYKVKDVSSELFTWSVDTICRKGFLIPCEDYFYVFPIIHTY